MPIFGRDPKVGGDIAAHGLESWWFSEFTDDERDYIVAGFSPLGRRERSLVEGSVLASNSTPIGFLTALSGWFTDHEHRYLARRVIQHAYRLGGGSVLDRHFLFSQIHDIYGLDARTDPEALQTQIWACREQISLSDVAVRAFQAEWQGDLPNHAGYSTLVHLCIDDGNVDEALRLCREAMNYGWGGPWEALIARLEKDEPWPPLERILAAADTNEILNYHFGLGEQISRHYRNRADPKSLEIALAACERQIAFAPLAVRAFRDRYKAYNEPNRALPEHPGFKQLAIIREKDKDYARAIDLCGSARSQGWAGDWDKRIERCTSKLPHA